MQSWGRGDIFYSPLWERMAREGQTLSFFLGDSSFSFICLFRMRGSGALSGRPGRTLSQPRPHMSAQWVCDTTEMPRSVLPFCLQLSTAVRYMRSGGLFWFFFFSLSWLRKPSRASHCTPQLGTNKESSITLPGSPCLLKGLFKAVLREL